MTLVAREADKSCGAGACRLANVWGYARDVHFMLCGRGTAVLNRATGGNERI